MLILRGKSCQLNGTVEGGTRDVASHGIVSSTHRQLSYSPALCFIPVAVFHGLLISRVSFKVTVE